MSQLFKGSVGLVIPTYRAGERWTDILSALVEQDFQLTSALVIDSNSPDHTVLISQTAGLAVRVIDKAAFNHGGTRQYGLSQLGPIDVVVFLTQDAQLATPDSLAALVAPFSDPTVAAVCGRQLPHLDANPLAEHARLFNYPTQSRVKRLEDSSELGLKTAFMSNSFAAYRVVALEEVSGFPSDVIIAEDMYVAARMLSKGWKIAYSGAATCYHSHNYSPWQEFQRYFDTGVFHAREPWIQEMLGGAGGEGLRYVISELKFLGFKRLRWWPVSLGSNFMKLLGYKLGQYEKYFPACLKRKLSMHSGYWK